MEIRNLGENDVLKVDGLIKELKRENPAIKQRIFDEKDQLDDILRRLGDLENQMDCLILTAIY